MKKIVLFLLVVVTCLAFVSCGESEPETVEAPKTPIDELSEDESEIEIKIDYIAEKLGLTDESDVMYGLIGAVAGKQYCNGNVELYQFDENSQAYKDLIGGNSYLTAAAYKDGVVLVFALGVEQDTDLVDAFNALDI